jgi:molybdopterin-guanine dinucleotide biosynthesis protein
VQLSDLIGGCPIITVSGSHKGVGKTALAEILLRKLPGFSAIKITITDDIFAVTDEERDIMSPATDTWRMKQSGALKVIWVRSNEHRLPDAMRVALDKLVPCRGMLIEGNSILRHLRPVISFFVVRPPLADMKPSRAHALQMADACVINQPDRALPDRDLLQRIKKFNAGIMILSLNLLAPKTPGDTDYTRLVALLTRRLV